MANTLEKKVKLELYKICKEFKAIVHHNVVGFGSKCGFPDETIIKLGGEVAFVECKGEGIGEEGLSPLQRLSKNILLSQKATWMLFNNSVSSRELLKEWLTK